jgi:hypothetical protein
VEVDLGCGNSNTLHTLLDLLLGPRNLVLAGDLLAYEGIVMPVPSCPPPLGVLPAASPRRLGSYFLDFLLRGMSDDSGGCCCLTRVHLNLSPVVPSSGPPVLD